MCIYLKELKKVETFERILSYILISIEEKVNQFNKQITKHNFFILESYIIFFMILIINLKDNVDYVKSIFRGKHDFFKKLKMLIKKIGNEHKKKEIFSIINNLFLAEYKGLFFREKNDTDLESLFINEQVDFVKMNLNIGSYDKETYKKIIDLLFEFDLSYDNFFQLYKDIKYEDRPEYKLKIAQSIIRVAFSKEKAVFTDEKYYEYFFIKKVIDKDIEETKKRFGDQYRTLFRKEDLCDDVIKYMFFIFGNSMLVESFVKPVKSILESKGISEKILIKDEANMSDITVSEYNKLIEQIISGLTEHTPHVIRILLKLLDNSIRNVFTIEPDNYSPLYTALIFNFLISPRIQILYSLNPLKLNFVRSLNRLIRNTCYDSKFEEKDPLSKFNDSVEKYAKQFQKFAKEKIIDINDNDDDVKNSLRDIFTEKYIIYPKFLFYVDSSLLCGTIQGGENKVIKYQEI